jgi:hypothetical protein
MIDFMAFGTVSVDFIDLMLIRIRRGLGVSSRLIPPHPGKIFNPVLFFALLRRYAKTRSRAGIRTVHPIFMRLSASQTRPENNPVRVIKYRAARPTTKRLLIGRDQISPAIFTRRHGEPRWFRTTYGEVKSLLQYHTALRSRSVFVKTSVSIQLRRRPRSGQSPARDG